MGRKQGEKYIVAGKQSRRICLNREGGRKEDVGEEGFIYFHIRITRNGIHFHMSWI